MEISRNSARMLGRTVINGVANASRMEVYRKNADVIDGVKWLATLDSRTCPVCGVLDGTIWKPDKLNEVRQPPAHPSCRCVIVPHIDLGPEFEATRAAAAENFDELAEKRYNEERKTDKPWSKLTYETRTKKRNKEIRDYEAVHGKGTAFQQVKSSDTFEDYLKSQTPEFRREYLGPSRSAAFESGTLKLDQMVSPDGNFVRTVDQLRNDGLVPPKEPPKTAKGEGDEPRYRRLTMEENLRESEEFRKVLSEEEITALQRYSSVEHTWINNYLRGYSKFVGDGNIPQTIQDAIQKWSIRDNVILFRGVDESFIQNVFGGEDILPGDEFMGLGFVSTSFDELGIPGNPDILLEIHVPNGTHAAPMTDISRARFETEWLLSHGTRFIVKSVDRNNSQQLKIVIEVLKSSLLSAKPPRRKKS